MQQNREVQEYIDNHNLQVGKPQEKVNVKSKQRLFLLSDKDPCGWPMRRFLLLLSSLYIRNPKNCKHKKYKKMSKKIKLFSICSVWSLTHCHSWNNLPCIQQQFSIITQTTCYNHLRLLLHLISSNKDSSNRSSNMLGNPLSRGGGGGGVEKPEGPSALQPTIEITIHSDH